MSKQLQKPASDPTQSDTDHQIRVQSETDPMLRKIITPIIHFINLNTPELTFIHSQSFTRTINATTII